MFYLLFSTFYVQISSSWKLFELFQMDTLKSQYPLDKNSMIQFGKIMNKQVQKYNENTNLLKGLEDGNFASVMQIDG